MVLLQSLLTVLFTFAIIIGTTTAFTAGAPPLPSVCRDMVPQHHEYKPQTEPGPYIFVANKQELSAGDSLTVYINSTDTTKIRGFYMQARDSETNKPIGTFTPNKYGSTHSCNGLRMNAITHNNGHLLKDYVAITWTAPSDYEGEVLILGTVLRDFVTFWSGIYTEPVTIIRRDGNTINRRQIANPFSGLTKAIDSFFDSIGSLFSPRNRASPGNRV